MTMNTQYKSMTPRTGKLVKSDGSRINEADLIETSSRSNTSISSRLGLDYRSYFSTVNMPAGTTYNFILDIPVNTYIYGLTRLTAVLDQRVNSTFLVGSLWDTSVYDLKGYNFDELLEQESVSTFRRVTNVTATPIPILAGNKQLPAQSEGGFNPKFDSDHFPVFRYQNVGNSAAELYVQVTWQEFPK